MNQLLSSERLNSAAKWLWAAVLLTIPITTFPHFPGPLGRSSVKPLALVPLSILLLVLILQYAKGRKIHLPANSIPLLVFLLFALASSAYALTLFPIEVRGADYLDRAIRAWLSVAFGLSFFFCAYWMNASKEDLRFTLKWLYIALGITLLWSLIQAFAVNTDFLRRSSIDQFQLLISERGVQPRRVTGFAFEPAWLADQLIIYFIPWLFAAMLTSFTFLKNKWIEWVLLGLSLAVLLFTFSRAGMLGGLVAAIVVLLVAGRKYARKLFGWLALPFSRAATRRRGLEILTRLILIAVLAIILFSSFLFAADYPYFANLWNANRDQQLVEYLKDINIAQRVAYASAAYEVFEDYPFSGVGLGASGLYLLEEIPDWALGVPEVSRLLSPDSNVVPNPKNLYARLLSETGLPGLLLFMAFAMSFLLMIQRELASKESWRRYAAIAGLFGWTAIMVRNLTQDSLTWPIMWVSLGIIAGLSSQTIREEGN
jgi:O-antigen ligase